MNSHNDWSNWLSGIFMSRFSLCYHVTVLANTLLVSSHLWRFDRGTKWKVRQRDGQTKKDEQEEHWGGAQSTSTDVNKQWQVTKSEGCSSPCTLKSLNESKVYWQPSLHSRQGLRFPGSEAQFRVIGANQQHSTVKKLQWSTMPNKHIIKLSGAKCNEKGWEQTPEEPHTSMNGSGRYPALCWTNWGLSDIFDYHHRNNQPQTTCMFLKPVLPVANNMLSSD